MLPPVRPAIDPLAHRSAIQALEAQRSAYARFARTMTVHRTALAGGSGEAAAAAADAAARGNDELAEGARRLGPLLAAAGAGAEGDDAEEVARRMDAVLREARAAEAAIRNLSAQLEAWRDAYGRQLAEVGLAPGTPATSGGAGDPAAEVAPAPGAPPRAAGGYGPARGAQSPAHPPSLIDRRG